jgi:hypothetical protein
VAAEVAKLRKVAAAAERTLDVCVNSQCRPQRWVHSDEGSDQIGSPLTTEGPLIIGAAHEKNPRPTVVYGFSLAFVVSAAHTIDVPACQGYPRDYVLL